MEECQVNKEEMEEKMMVKQLTVSDQQLIAEYHLLPKDDQKLVKAYMSGLRKAASILELQEESEI